MEQFLDRCSFDHGYIGIIKWEAGPDCDAHWGYGGYTKEQIEGAASEIEPHGFCVLHNLDGMIVAFDQYHLLTELEGTEIDVENSRLILRKRDVT